MNFFIVASHVRAFASIIDTILSILWMPYVASNLHYYFKYYRRAIKLANQSQDDYMRAWNHRTKCIKFFLLLLILAVEPASNAITVLVNTKYVKYDLLDVINIQEEIHYNICSNLNYSFIYHFTSLMAFEGVCVMCLSISFYFLPCLVLVHLIESYQMRRSARRLWKITAAYSIFFIVTLIVLFIPQAVLIAYISLVLWIATLITQFFKYSKTLCTILERKIVDMKNFGVSRGMIRARILELKSFRRTVIFIKLLMCMAGIFIFFYCLFYAQSFLLELIICNQTYYLFHFETNLTNIMSIEAYNKAIFVKICLRHVTYVILTIVTVLYAALFLVYTLIVCLVCCKNRFYPKNTKRLPYASWRVNPRNLYVPLNQEYVCV